jgi:ribosomal protein L40E
MTTLQKNKKSVKRTPCVGICQRCGLSKAIAGVIEIRYSENRARTAKVQICLRCKIAVGGAAA